MALASNNQLVVKVWSGGTLEPLSHMVAKYLGVVDRHAHDANLKHRIFNVFVEYLRGKKKHKRFAHSVEGNRMA